MIRDELVLYVEAALLAAGRPVPIDELLAMFEGREDAPDRSAVRDALAELAERWRGRALEVVEVASGFRAQVRKEFSQALSVLWQERPARYSRALLETLALIAYRQPISRGEIEEVRGVSVSTSIMKTLTEREWVRVVGHRETPGRPALYGTTRHFLDTFGLASLEALPSLAELKDLEDPPPDLFSAMPDVVDGADDSEPVGEDGADDSEPVRESARDGAEPVGEDSGMDAESFREGAGDDTRTFRKDAGDVAQPFGEGVRDDAQPFGEDVDAGVEDTGAVHALESGGPAPETETDDGGRTD